MKRDWFTRAWDDMTIGDRVAAMIAGCFLVVAFMLAAVVESIWGDDDL
jgi:hypothetical protein